MKNNNDQPNILQKLPPSFLAALTGQVVPPQEQSSDAAFYVEKGRAFLKKAALPEAVGYFQRALAIIHRFPDAATEMKKISKIYTAAAGILRKQKKTEKATELLVAAVEADPGNSKARKALASMEASQKTRLDITRNCYIFYDPRRAEAVHREAVLRALEYTSISGVIGDVMEFGVLGGWSARLFAETMRDLMVMGDLHLFDSFAGLPEYQSPVDQTSFEIAARDLWPEKMKFPEDFVAKLGSSLDEHIRQRLSRVIRKERVKIHPGFYSETLQNPPKTRVALAHIDCDLYQSAKEVLWGLFEHDIFQDGCVLMFDDWNCNKASPYFGERRAFREFLENQKRFTASDFFTYGFNGAVFILHEKRP
ncbi:MAG TPA: TylF/MycF/NovP-related O-methyltransferase [Candidatus Omnitrophota bacterium]|nr:TylF/MycF/NovP-related O-methyltransferase [Candidatus Omnitrophota bacterium]HRY85178.1 TylF/MycF/NovP-related O-methyltransferase [Candidatus Omnitrophota bacterium]